MILIPAIDLLGGKCVRLFQGDYGQVTEYASDPVAVARSMEEKGAKRIHVVDLDGAKEGRPVNADLILKIAGAVGIPIEVGGGIREADSIAMYFSSGVDRVILGTAVIRNPDLLSTASEEFPGRVYVGIDARESRVSVSGWVERTEKDAYQFARECEMAGAGGVIFTDIGRDGAMTGPNLESLKKMADHTGLPLIASGGISSLSDLVAIRRLGLEQIEGIITGKAIYSGAISLEEAIQAVEEEG